VQVVAAVSHVLTVRILCPDLAATAAAPLKVAWGFVEVLLFVLTGVVIRAAINSKRWGRRVGR
jgi:hypothetical protein